MRKMLNTLYITTADYYLSLENENVVVSDGNETVAKFPLLGLEGIVTFSYKGASPALMGECAKRKILLSFMSQNGKLLARTIGANQGNILLRRQQYRLADKEAECIGIVQNMLVGKLYNCKWVVERTLRDHALRVDEETLRKASQALSDAMKEVLQHNTYEELRGVEGKAATGYFGIFDELILNQKLDFVFADRNRRPPMDNVNAMLSFGYALLANECAAALETVGLDAYAGFMHRDRPGRASLALDMEEELRPCCVDRFVLTLINNKVIQPKHFDYQSDNAVLLNDDGRKLFIKHWQDRKREEITHPYLKEKLPWGLVPYAQALLLARTIRGDIESYPPFLWK